MKRNYHALACALLFIFSGGSAALNAQVQGTALGVKGGFYLQGGNFMLGAVGQIPITPTFDIEPAAEIVFGVLNTTRIVLDGNARYSFNLRGLAIRPHVMAGIGFVYDRYTLAGNSGSQSDVRLNIGAGVVWNSRSLIQYWSGIKIFFLSRENSDVALQAGVNFFL